VVSHILIHYSSGNEHGFVVWDFLEDFAEAFEGLLELVGFVIHQSQMKTATNKVFLQVQCLLEHLDCLSVQSLVVLNA
jgi:hypothetical protein